MRRDQNRRCVMCRHGGRQSQMTKLLKTRYEILKPWYSTQMKSANDWAHKSCLESIGLHPFPKDMIPLPQIIRAKLLAHIATNVEQNREVHEPRRLIRVVSKQMRCKFRVHTKTGRKELRRMVKQCVTLQKPKSAPKMEHLGREDYFSSPGLCTDAACERLQQSVLSHRIAPHSDVPMKRRQRADVEAAIEIALRSQPRVNVYLFDDHLPVTEGAEDTTLLVEDILQRFDSSRVRIWAPNLKQEIVDAHCGLATSVPVAEWLTSGVGCWHTFNDRWAEAIRNAGGLDIVFADCFRGFERGCGALVADLIQRTMFRRRTDAHDTRKCTLTFAVSDRYERTLGWSAGGTALQVVIDMMALYRAPNCPYSCDVLQQQ